MKTKTLNPITEGGEIDGIKFGPLSPPVIASLKRRGNVLLREDSGREQDEADALGEILFAASLTLEQRRKHIKTPAAEWDDAVSEFITGLGDKTLITYADAIRDATAKPKTKR